MTTTGEVRVAAEALMRHGDYYEEPDSVEWLSREAIDVAAAAVMASSTVVSTP